MGRLYKDRSRSFGWHVLLPYQPICPKRHLAHAYRQVQLPRWRRKSNTNGHGCSIGNGNGNCYSDANAYRIANAEDYAYTTAASYSTSSAVSLRACMQLSSGTREAIREFPKSHRTHLINRKWPR